MGLTDKELDGIYAVYEAAEHNITKAKKLLAAQGIITSYLTIRKKWEARNLKIEIATPGGDRGVYRTADLPDERELKRLYRMYEGNLNTIARYTKNDVGSLRNEYFRIGLVENALEEKVKKL